MPSPAMRLPAWCLLCGALAIALPARAAVFVCNDGHGGVVTTDHLDTDCLQYGGKELNPDGSVRQRILTQAQQREQQLQHTREQDLQEQQLRQQRQQRALLSRYPDDATLRKAHVGDLASVHALIDAARQRLQVLHRERVGIDEDAQFYPSGNYPDSLRMRMQLNTAQREQEQALIRSQQREIQRIDQRYAELRARLQPLWARQRAAQGGASPAN